eukprot:scaffold84613_cov55-Phaeocystis_antarctica.AAC.2
MSTRRSSGLAAKASRSRSSRKSVCTSRSCTWSGQGRGLLCIALSSTPTVTNASRVAAPSFSSKRTLYPTVPPALPPRSAATRSATAVAASRRGCEATSRHGSPRPTRSSSSACGTCVDLPPAARDASVCSAGGQARKAGRHARRAGTQGCTSATPRGVQVRVASPAQPVAPSTSTTRSERTISAIWRPMACAGSRARKGSIARLELARLRRRWRVGEECPARLRAVGARRRRQRAQRRLERDARAAHEWRVEGCEPPVVVLDALEEQDVAALVEAHASGGALGGAHRGQLLHPAHLEPGLRVGRQLGGQAAVRDARLAQVRVGVGVGVGIRVGAGVGVRRRSPCNARRPRRSRPSPPRQSRHAAAPPQPRRCR